MSMKVAPNSAPNQETWLKPMEFELQAGLIGFPDARKIELIFNPEELPFMWLRSVEDRGLNFVVVEPQGIVADYAIELTDDDAERLELQNAEDALVLNIVTVRPDDAGGATINLIGPIVINRRTLVGRQVVISNFSDYSARQPLVAVES
jgi:flagellar assembly factor FliW